MQHRVGKDKMIQLQGDVESDIGASATLIVSRRKGVMRGVEVGNAGGMAPMRVTVCVWGPGVGSGR